MGGNKFIGSTLAFLACLLPAAQGTRAGAPPREPPVPVISDTQRRFLSQLARRTMRDAILGRGKYEPAYVPQELERTQAEVVVRLRQDGFLRDAGTGGPASVAEATRNAALAAVEKLTQQYDTPQAALAVLNRLLVEIEVAGPSVPLEVDVDWTEPRAIDPYLEPGVHGLTLTYGDQLRSSVCPTELFTSDMVLYDALRKVAQQLTNQQETVGGIKLARFRTVHWYQPPGSTQIVSLQRGLIVLPPETVSRKQLDAALESLGDYLIYRQQRTGRFSYQYEPALDVYSYSDNPVRQAGATLALATYARHQGTRAVVEAADRSLKYHLQRLTDFPRVDGAAFIATEDGSNKLGVTALISMALAEHPDAERYAATRARLVKGILTLQRPSGMFLTAFPPVVEVASQDYFPGEALLALARAYEHNPQAEILTAFDRALDFYRSYFEDNPSPAFVPWQVQAFAAMARHTQRRDYVDYVFALTDWLAQRQLTRDNCAWPELWGGIAAYQPNRAGVATASYLEAFTDALQLARDMKDEQRAERYEQVVRSAARFVMQLQVRPEEAYFVRSQQDAVGGIRTSLALNLLRIDHCQHALVALLKTRAVLYP